MARTKKRIVKVYDLGPEPTDVSTQSKLLRAYQWYNYEYTTKDGMKFVHTYGKTAFDKKEMVAISKLSENDIPTTFMWQCRMLTNGVSLSADSLSFFKETKAQLLAAAAAKAKPKVATSSPKVKMTVQDRIREKISAVIAEIDKQLDELDWHEHYKYKFEFNMGIYEYLKTQGIKAAQASKLLAYYEPIRDELAEAYKGKDEQLVEAYSFLTRLQLKKRVAVYDAMLSDIKRHMTNAKAVRKPRKAKVKTANDLTKKVSYMKEFNELKLVSIDPSKIVGATQLWMYNTKYNQLIVLNALDGGFTIKGTTVQNFDEATSKMKRLRKPGEQLASFMKAGKVQLRKFLDTIRAKEYSVTGRINSHMILLKTS